MGLSAAQVAARCKEAAAARKKRSRPFPHWYERPGGEASMECFPGAGYTEEETDFIRAMDEYIRATGRKFPSWSEALGVLKALGYRKQKEALGTGDGTQGPAAGLRDRPPDLSQEG